MVNGATRSERSRATWGFQSGHCSDCFACKSNTEARVLGLFSHHPQSDESSCLVTRRDSRLHPLQHRTEHAEIVVVCESGFLDSCGCVRRWVKMSSRFVWFRMAVPATLPGRFGASFEIVKRVVAALEPVDIEPSRAHCRWILLGVEPEFEVAWREQVGLAPSEHADISTYRPPLAECLPYSCSIL